MAAENGGDRARFRASARCGPGTKVVVICRYQDDKDLSASNGIVNELDAWTLDTETASGSPGSRGPAPPRAAGTPRRSCAARRARIVVFGGEDSACWTTVVTHLAARRLAALRATGAARRCAGTSRRALAAGRAVTDVAVFGGVPRGSEVSGELRLDTMFMTWRELDPACRRAARRGGRGGGRGVVAARRGGGRRDTVALRGPPPASSSGLRGGGAAPARGGGRGRGGRGGGRRARLRRPRRRQVLADAQPGPAAGRPPMTKTKMPSPVKRKEGLRGGDGATRLESSGAPPREPERRDGTPRAAEAEDASRADEAPPSPRPAPPRRRRSAAPAGRRALEVFPPGASLAETRLQLDRPMRKGGGAQRAQPPHGAEPMSSASPPRRAKGIWGFLTGDAPEYRGANSSAASA